MILKNNFNNINNTTSFKKFLDIEKNKIFGFWLYLMSDFVVFATIFVVFILMFKLNFYNILIHKKLISLFKIFIETFILLISSFFCGLSIYSSEKFCIKKTITFLLITIFFGIFFIYLEFNELLQIFRSGFKPSLNGFFTSFFTLLGVHILHVFIGIIWAFILVLNIFFLNFTKKVCSSLICFSLFWHFLEIIWIFIYTYAYLFHNI